jgi:hypothetical protein
MNAQPSPVVGATPRFATPLRGRTYGAQVAGIARLVGFRPLDGQRQVFNLLAEVDDTGLLANRVNVLSLPRRSGKTESAMLHAVWRCLREPGCRVWVTAQSLGDAREPLMETANRLVRVPALNSRIRVFRGAGFERIAFNNGSAIRIFAPREDSLHGRTLDVLIADECWVFSELLGASLMTASLPAMATSKQPQVILCSSAGTARSEWWQGWVDRARQGDGVAGLDYGLEPGVEASLEAIAAAHPAVPGLVSLQALAAAQGAMSVADFTRSFGNVATGTAEQLLDPLHWRACATAAEFGDVPYAIGLDLEVDRDYASIAAAGEIDGKVCVEVLQSRAGVDWVLPTLEGMVTAAGRSELEDQRFMALAADDGGPARPLLDQLERAEVVHRRTDTSPGQRLLRLSLREWSAACATVFDLISSGGLRHREQAVLTEAVRTAGRRMVGDTWVWGRKGVSAPSSPLTACTAAVAGLLASKRPTWQGSVW